LNFNHPISHCVSSSKNICHAYQVWTWRSIFRVLTWGRSGQPGPKRKFCERNYFRNSVSFWYFGCFCLVSFSGPKRQYIWLFFKYVPETNLGWPLLIWGMDLAQTLELLLLILIWWNYFNFVKEVRIAAKSHIALSRDSPRTLQLQLKRIVWRVLRRWNQFKCWK
jgi:hypothetical protein